MQNFASTRTTTFSRSSYLVTRRMHELPVTSAVPEHASLAGT